MERGGKVLQPLAESVEPAEEEEVVEVSDSDEESVDWVCEDAASEGAEVEADAHRSVEMGRNDGNERNYKNENSGKSGKITVKIRRRGCSSRQRKMTGLHSRRFPLNAR